MIKRTLIALALGTALLGSVATVAHASGPLVAQRSTGQTEQSDALAPFAARSSEDSGRATSGHDDAAAGATGLQAAGREDRAYRSTAADDRVAHGRSVARAPEAEPGDR